MKKRVSFHTLGCKLNFAETSTLARQFTADGGFERWTARGGADVCIVNTCSVTEHAEKKCRNLIRRLVRENQGAIIAVTGCYAQLRPDVLAAIEGVDIVVGNDRKGELYARVAGGSCEASEFAGFFEAFSSGDRTRAFLKVQDGCDYGCSYCTIPAARGKSRNTSIASVMKSVEEIARTGLREVVITGINTGDYGRTTGETFADLLRALDAPGTLGVDCAAGSATTGIERLRISSIEPNLLTDEIIGIVSRPGTRFQPHFHIPLQSGSDRILRLMRRRYDTATFAERVAALRAAISDAFLGIDVIVGFPGETDDDFHATIAFLERLAPAFLHVFPYSARPGTAAASFPQQVSPAVSAARVRQLTGLSTRLHREFYARHIGQQAHVLFESAGRTGLMSGFTENYIKVGAPLDRSLIGRICRVQLGTPTENGDLSAEVI
ncbi:MAG: tRNA (N(6)-L-threonylcarbamoyladenosine(37)-C(2))-methylthiotransferase MtaB [Rikenellaceae bacterium]|nr:tRNA (N(6)-L-threonylcarbamoyladenosine(37)-C(2))-methylthiotransferase MtaB [Rikenellaceae bacterium]MCL2691882.1 tRNA (N(6)-L-threonylcarbamoyladenosine(37)-C(2))-methylthiotransferase MtaB [Rikenellaceae bacterium]